MNTIESIAEAINEFIEREMEYAKEDGVDTNYSDELEHILTELKDTAKFLHNNK
jgi:hypothetical protein